MCLFFFNDTANTEIYTYGPTLSLHDALPIYDTVTVRPIAGTRKRGATPAEDEALAQDLLSDPKELAEHLMLLDLGRNDVGRVAQIGTVKVTERNIIERYSHVMHIVSNVEGRIRPALRSEARRVGKECVSTCRSRGSAHH